MTDDNISWPIWDFILFPNGMISGLTLPEMTDYLKKIEERNRITSDSNNEQLEDSNDDPQASIMFQTSRFADPIGDDDLCKKKAQSEQSTILKEPPIGTIGLQACIKSGQNKDKLNLPNPTLT